MIDQKQLLDLIDAQYVSISSFTTHTDHMLDSISEDLPLTPREDIKDYLEKMPVSLIGYLENARPNVMIHDLFLQVELNHPDATLRIPICWDWDGVEERNRKHLEVYGKNHSVWRWGGVKHWLNFKGFDSERDAMLWKLADGGAA